MTVHPMTIDRAVEIHGRLVEAWMVREAIRPGRVPGFQDLRLADALNAVGLMSGAGSAQATHLTAPGISRLFAWAVVQGQMS